MREKETMTKLDSEWIQLIKEAKKLGIAKEEIRSFLSSHQNEEIIIEK